MKSSLSRNAGDRLVEIPIDLLRSHPGNSNHMPEEFRAKLEDNISLTGDYPPVVVRPHPDEPDTYQILDGHNRTKALRRLGYESVRCYEWPCDDRTALRLLATLNRLEGQDVPAKRAELMSELAQLASPEELASVLPESADEIERTISLLDFDVGSLLSDLQEAAETSARTAPRLISFAVLHEDEQTVMEVVDDVASTMSGKNRRGKALAEICRRYQKEVIDA